MTKKRTNKYFDSIRDGLTEAITTFEKGRKLTRRSLRLPEQPHDMSSSDIVKLRTDILHLSQHVFARLLNVSPKTVQAWEHNINKPSGPALRLLWLVKKQPDVVKLMIA